MLTIGSTTMCVSGIIMLLLYGLGFLNFWVVVLPVMCYAFGNSFIFPNAYAGALIPFPTIAGIAGAVVGFAQITGGSLASGIISALPDTTQWPLAMVVIFCGVLAILAVRRLPKQPPDHYTHSNVT